ncbi:hypothetical protein [Photobacterium damselae]|uniref:hypothetical protein n=1 Tax=Photobacterium damselae TaxID=38293 RepID=UPI0010FDD12C|nr:hypothetical protein [Photobacterium damselae]TLS66024.1 hypothetical protein FD718_18450 [Photobacterium damselae subsp. damselae]
MKRLYLLYGILLFLIIFVVFYLPVKPLASFDDTIINLNSPLFNEKLKELYEDNGISMYDHYKLNKLKLKIENERIKNQLKI